MLLFFRFPPPTALQAQEIGTFPMLGRRETGTEREGETDEGEEKRGRKGRRRLRGFSTSQKFFLWGSASAVLLTGAVARPLDLRLLFRAGESSRDPFRNETLAGYS
jgi:hypothetical protein